MTFIRNANSMRAGGSELMFPRTPLALRLNENVSLWAACGWNLCPVADHVAPRRYQKMAITVQKPNTAKPGQLQFASRGRSV